MADGTERWVATITAALLRRGRALQMVSLVILFLAGIAAPSWPWPFLTGLAAAAAEGWFAFRVAFDADLFAALAREDADLAVFDAAMRGLGLMPAERQVGTLTERARRAVRLLKWQAACLAVQALLLAAAFAWLVFSGAHRA